MSSLLLATKLYIPPVRSGLVLRPRLIARLDAGLHCKLTLVSAAAGFGKTTLVAEWLSRLRCPSVWLSLDRGDNDPVQFVSYLIAALQTVDGEIGQGVLGLLGTPKLPPIEALLRVLINDMAAAPEPFVLVLDDYGSVQVEAIHEAVEFLIDHQPPQLRLVLITRQDPPLPLPRLRVERQVVEVREVDLRFTPGETGEFLNQALGLDLDAEIVAALEARTEGWIAGLQLAALSIRARPTAQVAEFVELFSGSHRHVIDYLAEEVLARQSAEIRDFLCRTSILDRFTAPLCDEVTGRDDSKAVLRQLDESNLFLVPLDDHRMWYRYHHLFADFLRTELDEEAEALLHLRASRWLVAQGLLADAVKHALASGDLDHASQVVGLASAEAFRSGSLATVQAWLDALPVERVLGDSELATYQGYLLFFTGQTGHAAAYADAAEQSLLADTPPGTRGRLLGLKAHLALCGDDLDTARRCATEAVVCLEPGDAVFRNLTSNLLGQVLEANGDVVGAVHVYREAVRTVRRPGNQVGALVVRTNLVLGLNELGRRREAVAECQRAAAEEGSGTGRALPVTDGIYLAWSLLSYEANQLDQALEQVLHALDHAAQANIVDGVAWGKLILARVYLAQGALGAARQVAREGHSYVTGLDMYEGKRQWFAAIETQIDLLEGNLLAAARWAEDSGFTPHDIPHHWDELQYLTYVRVLLAQHRLDDAHSLLSTMERSARRGERHRKLITIFLLQAVAHRIGGHTEESVSCLTQALGLAAPEGYRRAFLDEGVAVLDLLPRVHHLAPIFVPEVLGVAPATGNRAQGSSPQALIEPLSERESEILRLIAAGRSNPEIADLLYLSLNTVKWHAKNLYSKLHVGSRVEAVARAQELGLL